LTRALGRRCTLQGFVFVQLIDKKKRSKQLHEYLKDVIGQLGKKIFLVKNVGMSTPVGIYGRTCSSPRARTGRALFVKGSGGFRRTIAATTTAASSSNC
jgi:hypothetical protein